MSWCKEEDIERIYLKINTTTTNWVQSKAEVVIGGREKGRKINELKGEQRNETL